MSNHPTDLVAVCERTEDKILYKPTHPQAHRIPTAQSDLPEGPGAPYWDHVKVIPT